MERTARGAPLYHLYLDSSAIVKTVISEPGTDLVQRAVGDAYSVRASEIAYPEARSAFARLHRSGALDDEHLALVVGWLDEDWEDGSYSPIAADAEVCRRAGDLAEKHALRAYDAVQLSTALQLRANYRDDPAGDIVHFLTFDDALRRAAGAEERLRVYEPPPGDDGDTESEA